MFFVGHSIVQRHRLSIGAAENLRSGGINTLDDNISLKISALASRHLIEALLGTPHSRCPPLLRAEGTLCGGHITLGNAHEISIHTLHIYATNIARQHNSHRVAAVGNRDICIGGIFQARCATRLILHLGIGREAAENSTPRQALGTTARRGEGLNGLQVALVDLTLQLREWRYRLYDKGSLRG
jgi:hypothetical protein